MISFSTCLSSRTFSGMRHASKAQTRCENSTIESTSLASHLHKDMKQLVSFAFECFQEIHYERAIFGLLANIRRHKIAKEFVTRAEEYHQKQPNMPENKFKKMMRRFSKLDRYPQLGSSRTSRDSVMENSIMPGDVERKDSLRSSGSVPATVRSMNSQSDQSVGGMSFSGSHVCRQSNK